MSFAYELDCRPDVNKVDSYRLRFPKWTSLIELICHVNHEPGYYVISIKGGFLERNHVLIEHRNNKWYIQDEDAIREMGRRFCNAVTVYSGSGYLEYAVELKEKSPLIEWINFMLKRGNSLSLDRRPFGGVTA